MLIPTAVDVIVPIYLGIFHSMVLSKFRCFQTFMLFELSGSKAEASMPQMEQKHI